MKLAHLALVLGFAAVGCGVDTAAPSASAGDDDDGPPTGGGTGSGGPSAPAACPTDRPTTAVSGTIAADATWMDIVHITGKVTIAKGVTVTVAPCTVVQFDESIGMTVSGTLAIQGAKSQEVTFASAEPGTLWSDIVVPSGGAITASYLIQTGGSYYLTSGATATFSDSRMSHAGGDLMVMAGGTLDMSYSQIGVEQGAQDTTHCDLHVSGPVNLKVTHSNISTSSYGIMYYGGVNADFTYDNWFGNSLDVEILPAYPVAGDFSYSYFAKGTPTSAGVTATHMASARVPDAGVR